MSMRYVREVYGVPAKRGMRVEVYYRPLGWGRIGSGQHDRWRVALRGRITSASHYIHVRPDSGGGTVPIHPTHGVVYFDKDGAVLLDTREDRP